MKFHAVVWLDCGLVMGHRAVVAVCVLRQQALDFDANRDRIIESIRRAKSQGARFRVGPELEIW